jgi:hypothetical protein
LNRVHPEDEGVTPQKGCSFEVFLMVAVPGVKFGCLQSLVQLKRMFLVAFIAKFVRKTYEFDLLG